MAGAEQTMEMIRLTVAAAVAEALKQLNFASAVVGGEDGGRSGGEGTMMWEVVDTIGKRTEKFGGADFQDWKFRIEMAVKGSCGRLHDFMEWAEDQELYIDPVTSVTEENSGYNSNLYYVFAQRTEREKLSTSSKMWRARTAAKHGQSFVDDFLERPAENDYISFANA